MTEQNNQGPSSGLTPHLSIPDKRASEAIDFYVKAFSATEHVRMSADDGVRLMHAHLSLNGASLMLADDFPEYHGGGASPPAAGVVLHLQVDNVDTWYDRAIAAGAETIMPPEDMFWGDRYAQVKDPFGHRWAIGAPVKAA